MLPRGPSETRPVKIDDKVLTLSPPTIAQSRTWSAPAKKSGTGHRLYRRKDVEMVLEIKRLLYEKRFTIEGARKSLKSKVKPAARKPAADSGQSSLFPARPNGLEQIRRGLTEILEILK